MSLLSRLDRRTGPKPLPHAFYARAVSGIDPRTVWAAACRAEFRAVGDADLRGILHHDGAILRFTTWGGVDRFVGSPMEFSWTIDADRRVHVSTSEQDLWFAGLESLDQYLSVSPAFVAPDGDLLADLETWMRSWS
jgi:hypothetical protein